MRALSERSRGSAWNEDAVVPGPPVSAVVDGMADDAHGARVEAAPMTMSSGPARQTADELVDVARRVGGGDDGGPVVVDVLAEPVEDRTTSITSHPQPRR